jgi:mRNA-degrading endonuclease YafQ of YafQ-DinJ toxin-antitoxin module
MEARFEADFVKALKKHAAIQKEVERKVRRIMEHPVELGEPLKGNLRGFCSCPVKRNFLIIFLYCGACRKKGDDAFVRCSDCAQTPDATIKFIQLGPHDEAYGIK